MIFTNVECDMWFISEAFIIDIKVNKKFTDTFLELKRNTIAEAVPAVYWHQAPLLKKAMLCKITIKGNVT